MAWFDRGARGKKWLDVGPGGAPKAPKTAPGSAPVSVATDPKAAPRGVEPPPLTAGLIGYLYKGSRVSGQLSFQGSARIDGTVDGDIQCQGTLTIGPGADVKAKITCQAAVIHGKVEGNVSAKEKIELIAPARLIGDIDTPRLIIAEGVVFDGDCSMGAAKQKGGVSGSHSMVADTGPVAQSAKANS